MQPNEVTRAVYLGQANEKRGIDSVLRALGGGDVQIDVVGPADSAVKKIAKQYNNVKLYGERPYKEAINIVDHADIGLCIIDTTLSNYQYSHPIKIFEYAALGKAIVASNSLGIQSLLTADESITLVDPESNTQIRREVQRVANDQEYQKTLGQNAQREIQQYTWPTVLEKFTNRIKEELDSCAPHGPVNNSHKR